MKRAITFSLVTAFAALTTTGHALAQDKEGAYVNIGVTQLSTELDLRDTDVSGQNVDLGVQDLDITMITGRIGYRIMDFVAIEGEVGFGLGGDDFTQTIPVDVLGNTLNVDADIGLDVKNYYVGFVRGILPAGDQIDLFARVGYGQAEAEGDVLATLQGFSATASDSQKEDGIAYGVGAQFNFTDNDGIRGDYTRLEDTDIISISYSRRF